MISEIMRIEAPKIANHVFINQYGYGFYYYCAEINLWFSHNKQYDTWISCKNPMLENMHKF